MKAMLLLFLTVSLASGLISAAEKPSGKKELQAKLQTKISVRFDDVALEKALAEIKDKAKVNIVCDPAAAKAVKEATVNLQVEDMSAEHALKQILMLAGFKFEVRDDCVWISEDSPAPSKR